MKRSENTWIAILILGLSSHYEANQVNSSDTSRPKLSIAMGTAAEPHEIPWQLSLQINEDLVSGKWKHICGASLLKSRYALTAAHCLMRPASSFRVVAGSISLAADDGVKSNVLRYKRHEHYDTSSEIYHFNDIAILVLATPILANGRTIKYASLPSNNHDQLIGRTCVISGWGLTGTSLANLKYPTILKKASIRVFSTKACNSRPSGAKIGHKQMCLHDRLNEVSMCDGDSGGPLNCPMDDGEQHIVAGIASWVDETRIRNKRVCNPYRRSVYTRTSAYLHWIWFNTQ